MSLTRKYFVLLRLQMLGLFSINKMIHKKGGKDLTKLILLAFGGLALTAVFVAFSYGVAIGPAMLGLADTLPVINLTYVAIATIIFTVMRANGVLFGLKDFDLTMSLPVNSFIVILSRLTMLYLLNLAVSAIVFIPSMIIYSSYGNPTPHGMIMYVIAMFLAPMIPMIVIIIVASLVMSVASRFRYRNLIAIILVLVALAAYIYFVFSMSINVDADVDTDMLAQFQLGADLGNVINDVVGQFYAPAAWLASGINNADWLAFGFFALVSLGVPVLYIAITSKFYIAINSRMSSHGKKSNFKLGTLQSSSPFQAMFKRELKRLTSNVTYMLNALIGPLMTIVLCVAFAVVGVNGILDFIGVDEYISADELSVAMNYIARVAPVAMLFFVGIFPPSCVALSLEGKNRWIMCSLPVSAITILKSKMAVSLAVSLPTVIICSLALTIALTPDILTTIFLFAVPIAYSVFISVFGMYINVKFPRYDWPSEYQLMKGGTASTLITIITGMVSTALLILIAILLIMHIILVKIFILGLLIAASAVLYALLKKERLFA